MKYTISYNDINQNLSVYSLNGVSGDFANFNPFSSSNGITLDLVYVSDDVGVVFQDRQNIFTSTLVFNDDIQLENILLDTNISHSLESNFDIYFYNDNELIESVLQRDSENTPYYLDEIITFDTIQLNVYFDYIDFTNEKIVNINGVNGYTSGYNIGYNEGYDYGYNQGYNNGYVNGYNEGVDTIPISDLSNSFTEVANTPITIFKQIFDVDILGFNLANACFGIVGILLIVWLIKKFLVGGD